MVEDIDLLTPPARRPHHAGRESAVLAPADLDLDVGAEERDNDDGEEEEEEALLTGGPKPPPPTITRPRVLLLLCLLVVGAPMLLAPLLAARGSAPSELAVRTEGSNAPAHLPQAQALTLPRRGGRGGRGARERAKLRQGAGKGGSPSARQHKQMKRRAAAAASSSTPSEQRVST